MADLEWTCNDGPQDDFVFGELGRVREILYGGQKGGGKSDAIGPKAYIHIGENPGAARVLILRETHPELTELIDRMRPQCLAQGAIWHEQRKTWTFPCGAKIRFGHLSDGCDPYWGLEFSLIIVDEVTRCIATEADYIKLLGSLRNSKGVPCQVVLMSNPGGKGHAWVKARFMGVPPRTVYADPETGLERVFIPASLASNPHLPREYRLTLEQLPEAERDAYLNGNWDAFEGRIFKLVPGVHIWTKAQLVERVTGGYAPEELCPAGLPKAWRRYRAYDHGFAAPGCCLWFAVDSKSTAYVYREYYTIAKDSKGGFIPNEGAKIEPRKVAARIAELSEGETYTASWTGPDLFYEVRQDQAGGAKVASHFVAEGLHFTAWRANAGSRLAGKQALHQRLSFETGEDGSPRNMPALVILDGAAPHLCRTLPGLEYDPHDVELWDSDGEDHAPDALMGFCKMNPLPTVIKTDDRPGWVKARAGSNKNSRVG